MTTFTAPLTSLPQLAATVRDARTSAGLTQTELAQQTGIPRPWINQLENSNLHDPGMTRVLKICDALNISLRSEYQVADRIPNATNSNTSSFPTEIETTETNQADATVQPSSSNLAKEIASITTSPASIDTMQKSIHETLKTVDFITSSNEILRKFADTSALIKRQAQLLDGSSSEHADNHAAPQTGSQQ